MVKHRTDWTTPLVMLAALGLLGWVLAVAPLPAVAGLVILVLGGVGGVVTVQQPLIGLALVLIIGPVAAYEKRIGITAGLPLSSGQLLFFALTFVWIGRWFALKRYRLPYFPLQWVLFLFATVAAISLLSAESMALGAKELLKWIEMTIIIWLVLDCTRQNHPPQIGRWPFWLVAMLLAPAVIQALVGIAQFIQPDGPASFLILGRFYRAFGTFEQPNPFGGFLGFHALLGVGIGLGWGLDLWQSRSTRTDWTGWIWVGVVLAIAGLCGVGLIASWSRGAWLGFLAGMGGIVVLWPKRPLFGIGLGAFGLIGLLVIWQTGLLPASISDRIASSADFELRDLRDIQLRDENFALLERLAFWNAAVGMAEQNLWFGVGFGNYDAAYADYAPEGWEKSLGHAHNYYLNSLAEIGILGTLSYVLFWAVVLYQAIRLKYLASGWVSGIALGLTGAWIAISVHHLVDKLYVNNIYFAMGTMLALQQLLVIEFGGVQRFGRTERLRPLATSMKDEI